MTTTRCAVSIAEIAVHYFSSGTDPIACDVVVAYGTETVTASTQFTYRGSLTPEITSVSPAKGGTAGGTRITISGSGFGYAKLFIFCHCTARAFLT